MDIVRNALAEGLNRESKESSLDGNTIPGGRISFPLVNVLDGTDTRGTPMGRILTEMCMTLVAPAGELSRESQWSICLVPLSKESRGIPS